MRTVIELDCGEMPPACGFSCGVCVQEIMDTLGAMDGISSVTQDRDNHIVVEHDPDAVSVDHLLDAISKLPEWLEGSFHPSVTRSRPTVISLPGPHIPDLPVSEHVEPGEEA